MSERVRESESESESERERARARASERARERGREEGREEGKEGERARAHTPKDNEHGDERLELDTGIERLTRHSQTSASEHISYVKSRQRVCFENVGLDMGAIVEEHSALCRV